MHPLVDVTLRKGAFRKLLLLGTVLGAMSFLSPAYAVTWTFDTPTGNLGPTNTYVGSDGITDIVASGFTTAGATVDLFGKNLGAGSDEQGVGLTNDTTGDNEITPGSFIQLNLANITNKIGMSFQTNSTTGGDIWEVFGSNTAGVLGTTSLGSCDSTSITTCDVMTTISAGGFSFLDVTAGRGNVLLSELDEETAVPLPGALLLFGTGLAGLGFVGRRRRSQQVSAL